MKNLCVVVSHVLISLFLVWVVAVWGDTYVSYYYPNVSVFEASPKVTFDSVAATLEQLAQGTNS